jgi:hypothetical protein
MEEKKVQIEFDRFGLRINGRVHSIFQFFGIDGFKAALLSLIKPLIVNVDENSVTLINKEIIEGEEIPSTKLEELKGLKFDYVEGIGMVIGNKKYYLAEFTRKLDHFKPDLLDLIKGSIQDVKNGRVILTNGTAIDHFYPSLYDLVRNKTCFGSLAYCCGLEKTCPQRDLVREVLGISDEDFLSIKSVTEEYFKKIVLKNNPHYFPADAVQDSYREFSEKIKDKLSESKGSHGKGELFWR